MYLIGNVPVQMCRHGCSHPFQMRWIWTSSSLDEITKHVRHILALPSAVHPLTVGISPIVNQTSYMELQSKVWTLHVTIVDCRRGAAKTDFPCVPEGHSSRDGFRPPCPCCPACRWAPDDATSRSAPAQTLSFAFISFLFSFRAFFASLSVREAIHLHPDSWPRNIRITWHCIKNTQ